VSTSPFNIKTAALLGSISVGTRWYDTGPYKEAVISLDAHYYIQKGDITTFRDAFARAKAHNLGITVHFGEAAATSSYEELMTLLSFQPDRLSHIIHVPDIVKQEIARRRLGLELCISCNIHARMGHSHAFADHHFGKWWKEKTCPLILCVSIELFRSKVAGH
jgi:adenosine deaminase